MLLCTECRVELVERSRYRIPDVLLCSVPVKATDKALKIRAACSD